MFAMRKIFCLGSPRPPVFTFNGSPMVFRGTAATVTADYVLATTSGGEPMKVHCINGYISCLYLVQYPERGEFVLLDTGVPSDVARVQFYIKTALRRDATRRCEVRDGVCSSTMHGDVTEVADAASDVTTMRDVLKLVVSSHCHIDHAGGTAGYEELGIPVIGAYGMEHSYLGPKGRFFQLVECAVAQFVAKRQGRLQLEDPFAFCKSIFGPYWRIPSGGRTLCDGASLPHGFDDWVAIHIPGHTSHMIGLYHAHTQIFYAADLFVHLRKGFFPPQPIDYDWAYSHTLRRLRGLRVRYVLLPHNDVITVEDYGGWHAILDEVGMNHQRRSEAAQRWSPANLIGCYMSSISLESRDFTRDHLHRNPLPSASDDAPAPFVAILR